MTDVAALQLLVPEAEPLLDAVRGVPRVGLLEPAHVSLGYPWRPADRVDRELVRQAAQATAPFEVRLGQVRAFAPDARGRVLVHAVPDDERPFRALAALAEADLRDVHLSLARVLPGGDVAQVVRRVEPLLPVVATLRVLELTVQGEGVWQPGERFPLSG